MEINIVAPEQDLPLERAYVVNMSIKSFKGRKNVEVHLFRGEWDPGELESYDWTAILGKSHQEMEEDDKDAVRVIMEAFTRSERDQLVQYLQNRYAGRLTAIQSAALPFPVPSGIAPLAAMPEDENMGRIRLEKVPNYPLDFSVHGFYDLSAHPPILRDEQF
ncbi:hypothetical protein [Desulfonatronospira sp.]|uniref:hypothetical protein n=1 Tax=Desulfonatronospira sp. TaxID=1962951 RepID=UPI0025BB1103|nr:hypothetical protein [Desulfonatronospira sp.]